MAGKWTRIEDVFPIKNGGYSIAMLDYRSVKKSFPPFWCVLFWIQKKTSSFGGAAQTLKVLLENILVEVGFGVKVRLRIF